MKSEKMLFCLFHVALYRRRSFFCVGIFSTIFEYIYIFVSGSLCAGSFLPNEMEYNNRTQASGEM
jgi:hypothetical protein